MSGSSSSSSTQLKQGLKRHVQFISDPAKRTIAYEHKTTQNSKKMWENHVTTGCDFIYIQIPDSSDTSTSKRTRKNTKQPHEQMLVAYTRPDMLDKFDEYWSEGKYVSICGRNEFYDLLDDKSGKKMQDAIGSQTSIPKPYHIFRLTQSKPDYVHEQDRRQLDSFGETRRDHHQLRKFAESILRNTEQSQLTGHKRKNDDITPSQPPKKMNRSPNNTDDIFISGEDDDDDDDGDDDDDDGDDE